MFVGAGGRRDGSCGMLSAVHADEREVQASDAGQFLLGVL
jgi:hypothetical protein